jgi:hypothetical protein
MKRLIGMVLLGSASLFPGGLGAEVTVSDAIEITPQFITPRCQMWPRAAWAEETQLWLVAWRDGHTNALEADIWCARVHVAGKTLDPAGIKVCTAADNQERPAVASDGKNFLVVWEDFRNGKDYDVYAARVSSNGQVLDPDGFLVAGGAHNQCHPVVVFAGGHYYVVWQGYRQDGPRYLLYGARVSIEGKVLDRGVLLTEPGKSLGDSKASAFNPVIASTQERILVVHLIADGDRFASRAAIVSIDPKTGRPHGPPQVLGPAEQRMPALACSASGALAVVPLGVSGRRTGVCLYRLDATGKVLGAPQEIAAATQKFSPLHSLAFDGQNYLLTLDRPELRGGKINQIKIWGWQLPSDGPPLPGNALQQDAVEKHGFLIAGAGDKYQMQGFACAGRKGHVLVTYVQVEGPDNLKLLARPLRAK